MKFRPATWVILMSALWSCDEESDNLLTYPSTFVKTHLTFDGTYHIFSSNGAINDQNIISHHIFEDTAMFNNRARDFMYPGRLDTIFFESREKASISLYYNNRACDVEKKSPIEYKLVLRDTISGIIRMNELSHHVRYYLSEVKPEIISETLISSVQGYYQFSYRIREPFVLLQTGDEVIVPVIFYRWSSGTSPSGWGSYAEGIFNKLNERFYEDLSADDTVSVMQAKLHFKRK